MPKQPRKTKPRKTNPGKQRESLRGCFIETCINNVERFSAIQKQICTVHHVRNWTPGCSCDKPPPFWLVPFPARESPIYTLWRNSARTLINKIDIGPHREPDLADGVCNHHFDGITRPYERTNLVPTLYLPSQLLNTPENISKQKVSTNNGPSSSGGTSNSASVVRTLLSTQMATNESTPMNIPNNNNMVMPQANNVLQTYQIPQIVSAGMNMNATPAPAQNTNSTQAPVILPSLPLTTSSNANTNILPMPSSNTGQQRTVLINGTLYFYNVINQPTGSNVPATNNPIPSSFAPILPRDQQTENITPFDIRPLGGGSCQEPSPPCSSIQQESVHEDDMKVDDLIEILPVESAQYSPINIFPSNEVSSSDSGSVVEICPTDPAKVEIGSILPNNSNLYESLVSDDDASTIVSVDLDTPVPKTKSCAVVLQKLSSEILDKYNVPAASNDLPITPDALYAPTAVNDTDTIPKDDTDIHTASELAEVSDERSTTPAILPPNLPIFKTSDTPAAPQRSISVESADVPFGPLKTSPDSEMHSVHHTVPSHPANASAESEGISTPSTITTGSKSLLHSPSCAILKESPPDPINQIMSQSPNSTTHSPISQCSQTHSDSIQPLQNGVNSPSAVSDRSQCPTPRPLSTDIPPAGNLPAGGGLMRFMFPGREPPDNSTLSVGAIKAAYKFIVFMLLSMVRSLGADVERLKKENLELREELSRFKAADVARLKKENLELREELSRFKAAGSDPAFKSIPQVLDELMYLRQAEKNQGVDHSSFKDSPPVAPKIPKPPDTRNSPNESDAIEITSSDDDTPKQPMTRNDNKNKKRKHSSHQLSKLSRNSPSSSSPTPGRVTRNSVNPESSGLGEPDDYVLYKVSDKVTKMLTSKHKIDITSVVRAQMKYIKSLASRTTHREPSTRELHECAKNMAAEYPCLYGPNGIGHSRDQAVRRIYKRMKKEADGRAGNGTREKSGKSARS